MEKSKRITAAEAKKIAEDYNLVMSRIYGDIKNSAEYNSYHTWFYFGNLKLEVVVQVLRTLRTDGYEIMLYEEKDCEYEEPNLHPSNLDAIKAILDLEEKDNAKEEQEKEEKPVWRHVKISWDK